MGYCFYNDVEIEDSDEINHLKLHEKCQNIFIKWDNTGTKIASYLNTQNQWFDNMELVLQPCTRREDDKCVESNNVEPIVAAGYTKLWPNKPDPPHNTNKLCNKRKICCEQIGPHILAWRVTEIDETEYGFRGERIKDASSKNYSREG